MYIVIHANEWKWGRSFDIISNDGHATVSVSVTKEEPEQAYISGLSVHESSRREGLGKKMMDFAIDVARQNTCKYAYLLTDKDSFVFEWYKRLGFKYYGDRPNDNGFVPMYMEL